MPIFYNFYILLATFYTIFGTNILIKCLVPVPVCCMFFVSQKIHIKRSPNGIKTNSDFLEYMWILGSGINARMPEGPTRVRGAPQGARHTFGTRGHSVRRLVPFFRHKKANIRIKIVSKFEPNRSYIGVTDLREFKKWWKGRIRERRNRRNQREIQSRRGSRPSAAMEAMD